MAKQSKPAPVGLNQHDFTATYKKYQRRIYSYVCSFGFDADQAADLTQEAFIKVYHNLHRHDPAKGTLISWIYRLTRNMVITHIEKVRAKRTESFSEQWEDDELIEYYTGLYANCSQPEPAEDYSFVRKQVEALLPHSRIVLELFYFRGFAYKDIGEELGIPIGTVKNRIHIAKNELRALLTGKTVIAPPTPAPVLAFNLTYKHGWVKGEVVSEPNPFVSSLDRKHSGLFVSSKEGRSHA